MKNISFIHYYREFGGNMGTKRSEILQGSQFFWFGALFFSQNWVNFKNAQNWPKYSHFSVVFRSLFNFGWKTAHQTQKIEFPEEFRFFGYPYCPQTRDNSGEIMSFMFCFEILWWKRPLVFFLLFSKWSLMSSSISHVSLEDNTCHIWPKNTGIVMCCIHFRHKFEWNLIHFS